METDSNCNVIIAGPGAGKTHDMVDRVLECMSSLNYNRFCAVVTYTNAATEEIRCRLGQKIRIPTNLFIGTTHSFLIRFIFDPFAHIFGITSIEKSYIDSVKIPYKATNQFAAKNIAIKISNSFIEKGIITFDKILEQSYQLILKNNIAKIVSNRLQFVFVDEYQDSRQYQHLILQEILKQRKTKIYCIGDPLQSIFTFTYTKSQLKGEPKPSSIADSPILDFQKKSKNSTSEILLNYRSRPIIVQFINNFNKILQQTPVKTETDTPIYFIEETEKDKIINTFYSLQKHHEITDEEVEIKNLFLSRQWNLFKEIALNFNLEQASKHNHTLSSLLQEVSRCILGLTGMKFSDVLTMTDMITYRKFCFKILRTIRTKKFQNDKHRDNTIIKMFQTEFACELTELERGHIDLGNSLDQLSQGIQNIETFDYYSTIHSAKGLEATSVLVCANTVNELKNWINSTDTILTSTNDNFRLGYVAFSRAREFLCISCLKNLTPSLRKQLNALGITFSSEISNL